MRDKNMMSWLSYLQSQKADTSYLALFKELVALAYKLLGGGDVDVGIDSARETHDAWRADKYESAAISSGRPRTPDRLGVSSRREFIRCGHVKRKLYEDAAGNVYRMFYGVLGYHAFDRREPWERDPEAPPAEDRLEAGRYDRPEADSTSSRARSWRLDGCCGGSRSR